jgi:hypothetical protein
VGAGVPRAQRIRIRRRGCSLLDPDRGGAADRHAGGDGWIIAALVLWAVAGAFGQRTGVAYMRGMTKAKELDAAGQRGANAELLALNRTSNGVLLHALTSVVVLLILLDMIFKPGA